MQIQRNPIQRQSFQAHGAKDINQMMTKLYHSAYDKELYHHYPDLIQISAKMKDGKEVTGLASFFNGVYTGMSFPYEHAHYRKEFCKTILEKYNQAVTKGKYRK